MDKHEKEISLCGMLVYVARAWKKIVLAMLACGILLGGFGYFRYDRMIKLSQPGAEITLKAKQKLQVDSLLQMENARDNLKEYLQQSVIMNMNPMNVPTATISYWVNTNHVTNYAGETEKDITDDVVQAYAKVIQNDIWRDKLLQELGYPMEIQYFSELTNVMVSGNGFTVSIQYPEEKALTIIMDAVQQAIDEFNQLAITVFGAHELSLTNSVIKTEVDNDLNAYQQSKKNELESLEKNIVESRLELKGDQLAYYRQHTNTKIEQNGPLGSVIKFGILGAVLGAFVLCIIRVLGFLCSDRLEFDDRFDVRLGIPVLGFVDGAQRTKNGKPGKIDGMIDSWSKARIKQIDVDQQINMAYANILLYCEENSIDRIYFNSTVGCLSEVAEMISGMLQSKGVRASFVDSIFSCADFTDNMSQADGLVLLEKAGSSNYRNVDRIVEFCRSHQKNLLGIIVEL